MRYTGNVRAKLSNVIMTHLLRSGTAGMVLIAFSGCAIDPEIRGQERVAQDPSAMMRIADAADSFGDVEGAKAFYRRAADLQPNDVAASIGVARSLARQGDLDQAIETLRSAKSRGASNTQLNTILGRLLVAANHPTEAVAAFEDGLREDPNAVSLLIGRGVALDATGRHKEAQDSYRQVLQSDPDNAAAQKDLALSLAVEERQEKTPARQP
jgi:Flp pilus assembly protein TadD